MYKEIESLTKTFQIRLGVIKDENGETLTETEKFTDRWKRYCEEMYSDNQPVNKDQSKKKNENLEDEPCLPPLKSEIEWAIKSLKDGKSPGYDNIQAEMIKANGEERLDVYYRLCTKIWETGQWPIDCRRAIFIPLPKRGIYSCALTTEQYL